MIERIWLCHSRGGGNLSVGSRDQMDSRFHGNDAGMV